MKNLIYFILAIILLSISCTKKDDGNVTPPVTKTPGQLHPEYLGKWHCDSVYKDGVKDYFITGDNYEFQDTKCIQTNDNNIGVNNVYDSWELSGTTLKLYVTIDDNTPYTMTIVSSPANNKMVLLDAPYTGYFTKQ
jgi:hypothetical protein